MKPRILVIDIGNTSTALGLYRAGKVSSVLAMRAGSLSDGELHSLLADIGERHELDGVCGASVVPKAGRRWNRALKAALGHKPFWVDHRARLGIKITYPRPETIGPDRLANAVGAVCRYGAPVIVADFGTALTFDVVSRTGGYVGGVIAPGLPLMFSYLAERTALLPRIGMARVSHRVGKSTEEAMRLGAKWGYRGMVREILAEVKKGIGPGRVRLCATGGFAGQVVKGVKPAMTVDRDLTLYGLGKIFELNRG
jgi:type III pantothenate kinase